MIQAAFPLESHKYPAKFWLWLRDNDHIRHAFDKRAHQMAETGRKRCSARLIAHVMRYESMLTDTDKQFKINNNYISGLARLWMETNGQQYPGFFKLCDSLGRDDTP
jgi:hypothetical protein